MGKQLDRDKVVKFLAHNRSAYCIDYGLLIDSLNSGAFDIDQEAEQLPIKEGDTNPAMGDHDSDVMSATYMRAKVKALEDRIAKLEAVCSVSNVTVKESNVDKDFPDGWNCTCIECGCDMGLDDAIRHKCSQ